MFDPRPDLGRPDRGILAALTAEPAAQPGPDPTSLTIGADIQAGDAVEWAYVIHGATGCILRDGPTDGFVPLAEFRRRLVPDDGAGDPVRRERLSRVHTARIAGRPIDGAPAADIVAGPAAHGASGQVAPPKSDLPTLAESRAVVDARLAAPGRPTQASGQVAPDVASKLLAAFRPSPSIEGLKSRPPSPSSQPSSSKRSTGENR